MSRNLDHKLRQQLDIGIVTGSPADQRVVLAHKVTNRARAGTNRARTPENCTLAGAFTPWRRRHGYGTGRAGGGVKRRELARRHVDPYGAGMRYDKRCEHQRDKGGGRDTAERIHEQSCLSGGLRKPAALLAHGGRKAAPAT